MYGADRFKEIFDKNIQRPLLLYGDPDVDGLISLLLMCQWADMLGLRYSYYVNRNRYHGFELSLDRIKGYMVVASDFQILEEEAQAIVDNDIVLLSTDHHDCQKTFIDVKSETAEGIVINNQYPFEPEEDKYLSGAGVFYELICSLYPEFKHPVRDALVGVTLLSDVRPIENVKAEAYLKATYSSDVSQGYLKYLVNSIPASSFSFGVPRLDRNFIDFSLSPCINSMLRYDKTDEAINYILGFGISELACRGKQKDLIREMSTKMEVHDLGSMHVLCLKPSSFGNLDVPLTNFIGLLCSNYKDKNGGISTLGFVYENGKVLRTSFRGRYDDIHYNSAFRNLGIDAHGHPTSFGIQNFNPDADLLTQMADVVYELEENHKDTITIINSNNLGMTVTQHGMKIATKNSYVRDMYRTYIRYTGKNIKVVRKTYHMRELTYAESCRGVIPDETKNGLPYIYERDENGDAVCKFIEYLIDGRKVVSFGTPIEEGLILPSLENTYIRLFVCSSLATEGDKEE